MDGISRTEAYSLKCEQADAVPLLAVGRSVALASVLKPVADLNQRQAGLGGQFSLLRLSGVVAAFVVPVPQQCA